MKCNICGKPLDGKLRCDTCDQHRRTFSRVSDLSIWCESFSIDYENWVKKGPSLGLALSISKTLSQISRIAGDGNGFRESVDDAWDEMISDVFKLTRKDISIEQKNNDTGEQGQ